MSTEVKLPRLGQGMESGVIVRWLKAEGDAVSKGEPLYELDTDKVTQEVESDVDGSCQDRRRTRARSRSEPPSPSSTTGRRPSRPRRRPRTRRRIRPPRRRSPSPRQSQPRRSQRCRCPRRRRPKAALVSNRQKLLPPLRREKALASRRARSPGGSPASAGSTSRRSPGTGPEGRILAEDVERAPPPVARRRRLRRLRRPPEVEVVQLTSVRKTIARRLTEAWTAPVFQLGVSVGHDGGARSAGDSSSSGWARATRSRP